MEDLKARANTTMSSFTPNDKDFIIKEQNKAMTNY